MTISNHREPLVPPPTPHGSDQKTQSAAGTSSSDKATLPSKTAAVDGKDFNDKRLLFEAMKLSLSTHQELILPTHAATTLAEHNRFPNGRFSRN